jgi:putative ABC transport system permease protein
MNARMRKVLGDLRASKARTALVGLSIAVGVAAVGTVVGARAMILQSLHDSRSEARFASATFVTDPLDARLVDRVRRLPGVDMVQARRIVTARLADGRDLQLVAEEDYERSRLARVTPDRGAWPPPTGAVLVERASLHELGAKIGAPLTVEVRGNAARTVRLAGTVHDLNFPSTRTSGVLYGYVTDKTLRRLGDRERPNELGIAVSGNRDRVLEVAANVRRELERSGLAVLSVSVPKPGTFWATDAVNSMVLLLTVLGVVCLLMSGLLVVNIVSALVTQQTRQIGVMKAIGASPPTTAALYLSSAFLFGVLALVLAVPIAVVAAKVLVDYSAKLINLDSPRFAVPGSVLALELVAGIAVPLLAAAAPVRAGSRLTVREAITTQGLTQTTEGLVERVAARVPGMPAAVRLAATNTFRRRRRLLLTLATIVLGGTVFLSVLSVRASLGATLDDAARYRAYDAEVDFNGAYPAAALERVAAGTAGVVHAEAWPVATAARLGSSGSAGETFTTLGVPAKTRLVRPVVLHGRWLRQGDTNALVVNTDAVNHDHALSVGRVVQLELGRRRSTWRVVGVVRGIMQGPVAYGVADGVARAAGESGLARRLQIVGTHHDATAELQLASAVRRQLEDAGYRVAATQTRAYRRAIDERNFRVLVSFLLSMAILVAIVGGLGLMGTLSINVLERSREIGVLRAIGAGDAAVFQLVLVESLLVAAIGWLVAVPLSIPASALLSNAVGRFFIGTPLTFTYSFSGIFVWLGLVLLLAAVAGLVPGRRAARLTVRDALVYN